MAAATEGLCDQLVLQFIASNKINNSLYIKETQEYGRGVYSNSIIFPGDFICEYKGDLITYTEALNREKKYGNSPFRNRNGCYIFFFKHLEKTVAVDATEEPPPSQERENIGRLINHSSEPNIVPRVVTDACSMPHLYFVACKRIEKDEQLYFSYGENRRDVIKQNPWLRPPPQKKNKVIQGMSPMYPPPPPPQKKKRQIIFK